MDRALRLQLLRAACTDRAFLKDNWHLMSPEMFPEKEEARIVEAAIGFYSRYETPIGALLQSEVEELGETNGHRRLGDEGRRKLRELFDTIQNGKLELVSARALSHRLGVLKRSSFYEQALEQAIAAHGKGELTAQFFSDLVERADKELRQTKLITHDYLSDGELAARLQRRAEWDTKNVPMLFIDGFDAKVRALDRCELGMVMAPPAGGKGLALIHFDIAYATQGWNVWHITLEDPRRLVENRLDAAITGLSLKRLNAKSDLLQRRFARRKSRFRGNIRITDGTDGGYTITRIEREWEEMARGGFRADVITIDYDDEIECEVAYKGDSARRFEFAEIYRRLRRLAKKTNSIVWTAAQPGKQAEDMRVITGKQIAEDYSKIRKVFLCLTVGSVPNFPHVKFLYVAKHREDRSHFGTEIVTDYGRGKFYDSVATAQWQAARKAEATLK